MDSGESDTALSMPGRGGGTVWRRDTGLLLLALVLLAAVTWISIRVLVWMVDAMSGLTG
jgi:hypothetical protein